MYDNETNWETTITFDKMHEDGEVAVTYTEQTMGEACIMFDALDSDYDPNGYTVETYRYLENGDKHLELRKHIYVDGNEAVYEENNEVHRYALH